MKSYDNINSFEEFDIEMRRYRKLIENKKRELDQLYEDVSAFAYQVVRNLNERGITRPQGDGARKERRDENEV